MENRNRNFKSGSKSVSEIRSRRNDVTIELRKSKKDDQLNKRRNMDLNGTSPIKQPNSPDDERLYLSLDAIMEGMQGSDPESVYRATQAARKTLSVDQNPPINVLIDHGIVPLCVKFLDSDKYG